MKVSRPESSVAAPAHLAFKLSAVAFPQRRVIAWGMPTIGSLDRRRFLVGCAALATCSVTASFDRAAGSSPSPVEIDLEAREAVVDVDGVTARLFTYNSLFPGPLIRAREGRPLRVRLTNRLAEPTNLHFHGLHVSPADNHDNVFVEVPPGETFAYDLTVPPGYGGTFWYHPHRHGSSGMVLPGRS